MSADFRADLNRFGERLESWKQIAAYLDRHVTTVRRWEKRESLAVHRHAHSELDSVYAYSAELDEWIESRKPDQSGTPSPNATLSSES